MAYDPNDPADKAILDKAVKDALAAQAEEHEAEVERLNNKNTELLGKLKKAREAGGAENSGEVERLESDLADTQSKLRKADSDLRSANRDLASITGERDTAVNERDGERTRANNEFVGNRLTSEFAALNVGENFREDLTEAMRGKVVVKEVNGERQAFIGDKSLTDHLKEWAETPKGKHYVLAPNNSGGNATGSGGADGGPKKIWQMNTAERVAAHAANPSDFDARVKAGEAKEPKNPLKPNA